MGIDIYLSWDNMTKDEEKARYTGFSIVSGHLGYLREAYHGYPYATRVLCPEAFDSREQGAIIQNSVLVERLPAVLRAVRKREREVYQAKKPDPKALKSFRDFVKLHGEKEKAGLNPRIEASY